MTQQAVLVGNLCDEPALKFTNSGSAVCDMRIAVDRWRGPDKESEVSYYDVVAWQSLAENVAETLHKGMRVVVVGRMEQQRWEDKDTGDNRSKVVVVADEMGPSLRWSTAVVNRLARTTRDEPDF